jgi:phage terminase large subunit
LKAVAKLKQWRSNPIVFVKDNFGVTPDKWQEKALMAFASGEPEMIRISLQACAGPGKSAVLAWCGWNFLSCYGEKGEHPKGAAVSITKDNLKDNLWVELAKWQHLSIYLSSTFTWTQTRIFANDHKETWFLSARSFPNTADPETLGKTLSGVHSKYVLFLIDESGDIPVQIAKAAEQAVGETTARKGFVKILQAGNPISSDGMLYSASISKNWHVIRITGDPEDDDRSPRIDKAWAELQIDEHGRDDPWVSSYILGHFPKSSVDSLLSIAQVEAAMERTLSLQDYSYSQKRLGVDVARGGMDSTVIFPRQGLAAFKYTQMRNADGTEVAARVLQAKARWNYETCYVDDTGGFGGSVLDQLKLSGHPAIGIHFAGKATNPRYFNKRSEMWLEMAEWIKRGGALPKCNQLKKELISVKYFIHKGKLQLESKDQIKKRLGFSPDMADALGLTFAQPDQPAKDENEWLRIDNNNLQSAHDPMKEMNGNF